MLPQADRQNSPKPPRGPPPPPPPPRKKGQTLRSAMQPARPPPMFSEYLMSDIPRGTSQIKLINFLLAPGFGQSPASDTVPHVQFGIIMTDSRLDDELSVAAIEFTDTPQWLQALNQDPCGFPKTTPFGTIWRGVDRTALDDHGQTEFIRAVRKGKQGMNFYYAEMLVEFQDTDVNVQDMLGRTALHWACAGTPAVADMVSLCLSVPECDVGLKDHDGLTAFDISSRRGDEGVQTLFYQSMFEMDTTQPQAALLRALTVSSVPACAVDRAVFPGEAMFDPVETSNGPLVKALIARGVDLTATNDDGDTVLHLAAAKRDNLEITTMLLDAGSDVNAVGNGGATPLHYAIHIAADRKIVQVLLDHRANVGAKDSGGRTALQLAEENLDEELVALLNGAIDIDGHPQPVEEISDVVQPLLGDIAVQDEEGGTVLLQPVVDGDLDDRHEPLELGVDKGAEDRENPSEELVVLEQGVIDVDSRLQAAGKHSEALKRLLGNINLKGADGRTALHRAAVDGDLDTVRILFELGAETEVGDQDSRTALHLAVVNGHTETIETLLAGGAQIEAVGKYGYRALHLVAEAGHAETVKTFLAGGAQTESLTIYKDTALHLAAKAGHAETVKTLLAGGAQTEAMNKRGYRALHLAAQAGHSEAVRILLAGGAQTEALTSDQDTALHLATKAGHAETVRTILAGGAQTESLTSYTHTALHLAAMTGHAETVKTLLAGGAQTEAMNKRGYRALHLAAQPGHSEAVRILLAGGAQTEALTSDQDTALHLAAKAGRLETVKTLLAGGAQIEAMNKRGYRALHLAAEAGHAETVKTLLAGGAETEALTSDQDTALHLAAKGKYTTTVETLLVGGAEIEAADRRGNRALHIAAYKGDALTVQSLLDAGAKIEEQGDGGTALQQASKYNRKEVVAILRANGARTTFGRFGHAMRDRLGLNDASG